MNGRTDLTGATWLADLNDVARDTLLSTAKKRALPRRGMMISSDELSQRIFLLLSGRMNLLMPVSSGEEALLQQLRPGDVFCPVALLRGGGCAGYALSMGACLLLGWTHEQFRAVMHADRRLYEHLFATLAEQVDTERHKRCLLQCANVRVRVAAALLAQVRRQYGEDCRGVVSVDIGSISLAARELGMARETMSRILSAFEAEGILLRCRGVVKILALARLRDVGDGLA